jgi:PAS domain S-box-containing protein
MKASWQALPALAEEAGPGGWTELLEAMIHAVWLVDADELRIVGANAAAGTLCGTDGAPLGGRSVLDFAATPDDHAFWREVASGLIDSIETDALLRRIDEHLVPVSRRVTRLRAAGSALYLGALDDRSEQRRREAELEETIASLQSTLDSLVDGVLVTDLRGRIRNFNRRFADLWELPEELLSQRRDDAIHDWMRASVIDPSRYMRRLATIDDATMLRASDIVMLRSGRVIERVTLPQCSRGQPVGRVFTFREIRQPRKERRPA